MNVPPGPRGGRALRYLRGDHLNRLRAAQDDLATYGDLVYVNILGSSFYLLNHPDDIQAVLVTHADQVYRRKIGDNRRYTDAERIAEKGDHRRLRKLIQPAFQPVAVARYGPTITQYASEMLDTWQPTQVLNLGDAMTTVTLRIVARALFDVDVSSASDAFSQAITLGSEYLAAPGLIPLPTPRNLRLLRAWGEMERTIKCVIAERRASGQNTPDLLSTILNASDEGGMLTEQEAFGTILALFIAGHETTATLMTWAGMLLAQHPDIDADLAAEIASVVGDRPVTAADLERLPLVEGVIRETLRLYPPAWVLARWVLEPFTLREYTISKNSTLLMSPYLMQRDPRFYDAPEQFVPRRWPDGTGLPRYAYFPFGGGPHICTGMFFALMEAQLLLATIVQRFRFAPVDTLPVGIRPLVTLRPDRPVQLQVLPRR